jgi:endonuclease/exonuclease/phosphatase family metal-dependent hydrolase
MPKPLLIVFLFLFQLTEAQVQLVTWNIENFGASKTVAQIEFVAEYLRSYDVIALQEVVAGIGGAQQVAALADELNRKGSKWDYIVSNPTVSSAYKTERYAYLWKPSRVELVGKPWLVLKYAQQMDREPYMATFKYEGKEFTLVNFHAITESKQPETELKYLQLFPELYPKLHLIFLGDFNCPQSHTVFQSLRNLGFTPSFVGQKTSMRKECVSGECLSKEFDNIWYPKDYIHVVHKEALLFYERMKSFKLARQLSDHIPLVLTFNFL